jgi:hypothetical protein
MPYREFLFVLPVVDDAHCSHRGSAVQASRPGMKYPACAGSSVTSRTDTLSRKFPWW